MGFLWCRLFHGIQWLRELKIHSADDGELILGMCNCGREYFLIPIKKKT